MKLHLKNVIMYKNRVEESNLIRRTAGNDVTKDAISSIVRNLQKTKPDKKHIEYSLSLDDNYTHIDLSTDENYGKLKPVSYLNIKFSNFVHGIRAVIGNDSGKVIIEEKSPLTSRKKAEEIVIKFLTKLQSAPEDKVVKKINTSNSFFSAETNPDYQELNLLV